MPHIPRDVREIAQTILTPKQYEAWTYETQGYGMRTIAAGMHISRTAASDHIAAAHRKLLTAGVRINLATGNYELEKPAILKREPKTT